MVPHSYPQDCTLIKCWCIDPLAWVPLSEGSKAKYFLQEEIPYTLEVLQDLRAHVQEGPCECLPDKGCASPSLDYSAV